jgi:DNA modification methylase
MLEDNSVDAVITDPPYLNLSGGLIMGLDGGVANSVNPSISVGNLWDASLTWTQEAWRVAKYGVIVFCGYNSVPETRAGFSEAVTKGLAVWHYSNPSPSYRNVPQYDVEFIWLLEKCPGITWRELKSLLLSVPKLPAGCFATERVLMPGSKKAMHPCQKPVELMRQLILEGCNTILDPFMGLGSTGIACVEKGRNFIGIEIDPNYYAIAEQRIAAEQAKARQMEMAL